MEPRDEVLLRAESLFKRFGIRSVTMDDIARELGISKKTLYQHFDNKDKLVEEAILRHLATECCTMAALHEASENALDELRRIAAHVTHTIEDVSPGTLFDLRKYYRSSWELLTQKQDENVVASTVKNLRRGQSEGYYRKDLNVEIVANIYAKAVYVLLDEIIASPLKVSREQLIHELHDYHIHAVATPAGLKRWQHHAHDIQFYDQSLGKEK